MKTNAKSNSRGLLGVLLAITAFAMVVPGYAQYSSSGINSFHVLGGPGSGGAYGCVYESYGAVVNGCGYPVSLTFDLPVTTTGNKTITAWDSPKGGFTCQAISFSPTGGSAYWGTKLTFPATPTESLSFTDFVGTGFNLTLYCWNIPSGSGIASLSWTD